MEKIKFTGVLGQLFQGYYCIRGYASAKSLKKISTSKYYQRKQDDEHTENIRNFIKQGKNLMYPEIILGYRVEYNFSKKDAISGINPLSEITSGKKFKSNIHNISFKSKKITGAQYGEFVGCDTFARYITLEIGDFEAPFFSRIDGNHRLEAIDKNNQDYLVPFSIILFEANDKKSEVSIFHNINGKGKPLLTEKLLENICDTDIFSSQEVQGIDPIYHKVITLKKKLNNKSKEIISNIWTKEINTGILEILKFLEKNNLKKVDINKVVSKYSKDFEKNSKILFLSFLYFYTTQLEKIHSFISWAKNIHLYELKNGNANNVVDIFKKEQDSKKKTIFISTEFNNTECKERYKFIKEAIEEINNKYNLDVKIRPLKIDEHNLGESILITEEILEQIQTNGYLIADISTANPNVYHEIGFLMGVNKQNTGKYSGNFLLIKDKESEKPRFNISNIRYKSFDTNKEVKRIIKESLVEYYELEL